MRLLIADRRQHMAAGLKALLERQKYAVDLLEGCQDVRDYCAEGRYDGLILCEALPEEDALSVLRSLRAEGLSLPVFLLCSGGLERLVEALESGADECLSIPFAATEFLARVRAMLRRGGSYVPDVLSFGALALDTSSCVLLYGRRSAYLNRKEFQTMELLLRARGAALSTEQLMERIWGWDSDAEIHVVWTNIARLRQKLRSLGCPITIRSVRGVGYLLEDRRQAGNSPSRRSIIQ